MSDEIDWEKIVDGINNRNDEHRKEREAKYNSKTVEEKIKHQEAFLQLVNCIHSTVPGPIESLKIKIQNEKAELQKQVIKDKLDSI